MANRGRPLPFNLREQIKEQRREATVRVTAAMLGVSKTTVQKYGKQR